MYILTYNYTPRFACVNDNFCNKYGFIYHLTQIIFQIKQGEQRNIKKKS